MASCFALACAAPLRAAGKPNIVYLIADDLGHKDAGFQGGLRDTQALAKTCEAFGVGLSMHSNSHLGISLAAMVHVAAATPYLTYACDTHWPWRSVDVVAPGALEFRDGAVAVPDGPGLGVVYDWAFIRKHRVALHEFK